MQMNKKNKQKHNTHKRTTITQDLFCGKPDQRKNYGGILPILKWYSVKSMCKCYIGMHMHLGTLARAHYSNYKHGYNPGRHIALQKSYKGYIHENELWNSICKFLE